jgi:hypothetical protein
LRPASDTQIVSRWRAGWESFWHSDPEARDLTPLAHPVDTERAAWAMGYNAAIKAYLQRVKP